MTEQTAPKKLYHVPVLLTETLDELAKAPQEGWIVDCTYGDGGHSYEIYTQIVDKFKNHQLLSIDWDLSGYDARKTHAEDSPVLLDEAEKGDNWILAESNFTAIADLVTKASKKLGVEPKVAGVLLDLGISSRQYVQKSRGFSFSGKGRVDMRMSEELYSVTAYDLINNLPYKALRDIFINFTGMPDFLAAKLTKELILARDAKSFGNKDDVDRLNEIAYKVQPIRKNSQGRIHPATLLFLALRIAVNTELQNLREVLPNALSLMVPKGKILPMTYHSSEERIVEDFAIANNIKPIYSVPTPIEIRKNPRSRSAKLYSLVV